MNSIGRVVLEGAEYYLYLNDVKKSETFYLFSKLHVEDRVKLNFNDPDKYPLIRNPQAVFEYATEGYLVETYRRAKLSGKGSYFRNHSMIEKILSKIAFARMYNFSKNDIIADRMYVVMSDTYYTFEASDANLSYRIVLENGTVKELSIVTKDFKLELNSEGVKKFKLLDLKHIPLTELNEVDKKRLSIYTIKDVSFEDVCNSLNIDWYYSPDTGYKFNYVAIDSIRKFELQIITPLVLAALERRANGLSALDLAIDTETTGFNMYDLSDTNELKDNMVAVPITWLDDTSFTIFIDMEHFSNVPKEYVIKRLVEIGERFKGERELTIYREPEQKSVVLKVVPDTLEELSVFLGKSEELKPLDETTEQDTPYDDLKNLVPQKISITRDLFNIVGHNTLFDTRVIMCEVDRIYKTTTRSLYFDDDTLQLSFNLNPGFTKHSRALKPLTKRLLGFESPGLSDVLGKGNEDKYRYLSDLRVALLYGCSDALFTLKILRILRALTSKSIYQYYRYLDMRMIYKLAEAEYRGVPIDSESMSVLAENAYKDIEKIKKLTYHHVGIYMDYVNKNKQITSMYKTGELTEQEYKNALNNIKVDPGALYKFEFKASQFRSVMFDILKYPVTYWTKGAKPLESVDKDAIKKLVEEKNKTGQGIISKLNDHIFISGVTKEDYEKAVAKRGEEKCEDMILVNAKTFNECKHPVAYLLSVYATINKDYTSYFKPMLNNNLEGRMYKNFSMSRIETRRIMNSIQTMKGTLKALVRAISKDHYMIDFDMSQVEYRIMVSLAEFIVMIEKMRDPENDYHVETAALVNFIPAHKVSKEDRKKVKNVSFGVPYGLGERKLCERMFKVVNEITLQATRLLLHNWKQANAPVMNLLNKKRDEALVPRNISNDLRDFLDMWEINPDTKEYITDTKGNKVPIPVGFIENPYGFYRIFNLKDLDDFKINKIRNAAGNYPIQCYAAEMFRTILIRFYDRCLEEGIDDKVIWHMLVHDELLLSCHKSIHPFFMYKIISEECMLRDMDGHTNYFVGINVGLTWAETKDDSREAPVKFVDDIVARWDAGEFKDGPKWFDDPWSYIKPYREEFVKNRIGTVLKQDVQSDIEEAPINVKHILSSFQNYTVRAYVGGYPTNFKVVKDYNKDDEGAKDIYEDRVWASKLESWALEYYGENKMILDYDGNLRKLGALIEAKADNVSVSEPLEIEEVDLDFSALFDDEDAEEEYWTLDETEIEEYYDSKLGYDNYASVVTERNTIGDYYVTKEVEKGGVKTKQTELVTVRLNKYNNIKLTNSQLTVNILTARQEKELQNFVAKNRAVSGYTVIAKTYNGKLRVIGNILITSNLDELDKLLDGK